MTDPVTEQTYNMHTNPPTDPEVLKRLVKRKDDDVEYIKARYS
jgi:hypothetical protein